jgi:hypothetical protein
MSFRQGDRVRIRNSRSEYTGCRGTITDPDADPDACVEAGVTVLGRLVAIDGENGIARPFLIVDLEPLRAMRVAPPSQTQWSREPGAAGGDASE